ncbi:conserved hypothetical protein, partial [Mycobacterium tuberculosis CPHL_A]
MSNLLVTPELVAAAAADLAGIGSAIGAANAAAGAPTMALLAAGADEVSAAVAAVFSSYRPAISGAERCGGGVS